MSKPIETTQSKPLVHRPWDVLDSFGSYDAQNRQWVEFSASVSKQIRDFELMHPEYMRLSPSLNRRSIR